MRPDPGNWEALQKNRLRQRPKIEDLPNFAARPTFAGPSKMASAQAQHHQRPAPSPTTSTGAIAAIAAIARHRHRLTPPGSTQWRTASWRAVASPVHRRSMPSPALGLPPRRRPMEPLAGWPSCYRPVVSPAPKRPLHHHPMESLAASNLPSRTRLSQPRLISNPSSYQLPGSWRDPLYPAKMGRLPTVSCLTTYRTRWLFPVAWSLHVPPPPLVKLHRLSLSIELQRQDVVIGPTSAGALQATLQCFHTATKLLRTIGAPLGCRCSTGPQAGHRRRPITLPV
jgi:hypothetical protein